MKRWSDTEHFERLGDMSFKLKALLFLLQCKADRVGVVLWNQKAFEGLAGGENFPKSDLDALGKRVVWVDHERLLLPHFLAFQYGCLSRRSKAHACLFDALNQHFPREGDEVGEPFVNWWVKKGIGHLLPEIVDEIHAGQTAVWERELKKSVEDSRKWKPSGMDEEVISALEEYYAMRCRMALRVTTKQDAAYWHWGREQAASVASLAKKWLKEHKPAAVALRIINAANGNRKDIYPPKWP